MDTRFEFFDINAYAGLAVKNTLNTPRSAPELLAEMGKFGVNRAVVWHIAQHDYDAVEGNRLTSEMIEGQDRLLGCWSILPPQTGEVINDGFFSRMSDGRIVALRAFPQQHHFLLNSTVFGAFFEKLSVRRVPLLLSLSRGMSWDGIYSLMQDFPQLTCVLCDIGIWGVDRYTWPLLEKHPNLFLETSCLSLEEGGVEAAVTRFGAERLLFGTGFPERYPSAAVLQLLHAEISDDDKAKIASGNLQKLIESVRL